MKFILSLTLLFFVSVSQSQDRYFASTYTANILQKGAVDLELWHTSRFGHTGEFFHAMDQRMELELGLGKSWQTALYFNHFQKSFSDSNNNIVHKTETGFSNEWKWQVNKPGSKLNIALYGELGIKGDEIELETKLILDRSFGKNLVAFNLVYEREYEFEYNNKTKLNPSNAVELDLAFMHFIKPQSGIGLETVLKNSIIYAGPTFTYRSEGWFVIANYLPQLFKTNFTDHERTEARILLGVSL